MYIHSLVFEFDTTSEVVRFREFMDTQLPEIDYTVDKGNGYDVFYIVVGKMMKHQLQIIVENF